MSSDVPSPSEFEQARRIDALCDAFETDLMAGNGPRIEDWLARVAPQERPALLKELLNVERELATLRGEKLDLASCVARFPEFADVVREVLGDLQSRQAKADPHQAAERNLLFGILALQNNLIDRRQLVRAFDDWVADKSQSLADLLVQEGALTPAERELMDALMERHLERHGGDAEKSLAVLSSIGSAREDLSRIPDPHVQASLGLVSAQPEIAAGDPDATLSIGVPTAPGTRFRILRPHAKGGLGEVYVAEDEELHRNVALKQIQDRHADHPEARARFVREAEITGALEHPGIVPVYGLGTYADGRPFYAMRFIKGDSLQEAVDRFHSSRHAPRDEPRDIGSAPAANSFGSLAFRKLLQRFIDVCNAIEYAHSRGVLHRDLKPGNIMLGKYGETLVVDWGLAKCSRHAPRDETRPHAGAETTLRPSSASGSAETQLGTTIGTPAYMSPEQAAGQLDELGPASDVYSLGATLYYVLTGTAPFSKLPSPLAGEGGPHPYGQREAVRGSDDLATLLRRVQSGDFPSPRQINSGVPSSLEAVCLKAMSLVPSNRYASPRDLAGDLEQWLADEPIAALPDSPSERIARWSRRHRTWIRAAAASLMLLVAVMGVASALIYRQKQAAQELAAANARLAISESKAAADARQRQQEAESERARAQQKTIEAEEQRTHAEWLLYAAQISSALQSWGSNDFLAAAQSLMATRTELRGWEHDYVAALLRKTIPIMRFQRQPKPNDPLQMRFSPDASRVLVLDAGIVEIFALPLGNRTAKYEDELSRITTACLTPDNSGIVYGCEDGSMKVWSILHDKLDRVLPPHPSKVISVAVNADGGKIASLGSELFICDGHAREPRLVIPWPELPGAQIVFSPDGRKIIARNDLSPSTRIVTVWNTEDGTRLYRSALAKDVSPDGTRVLEYGAGNVIQSLDIQSNEVLSRFQTAGNDCNPQFSQDGSLIAFCEGGIMAKVCDANSGMEVSRLIDPLLFGASRILVGSDSKHFITSSIAGTYQVRPTSKCPPSLFLSDPLPNQFSPKELSRLSFRANTLELVGTGHDVIRLWEASARRASTIDGIGSIQHTAVSPDGATVLLGNADTLRLVSLEDRRVIRMLDNAPGNDFIGSFNPTYPRIVSGDSTGALKIWDAAKYEELQRSRVPGRVVAIAHSADGKLFATAFVTDGRVSNVAVFQSESLQQEAAFEPPGVLTDLVFQPKSTSLLSVGSGLYLWDARSGQRLIEFQSDSVQCAAFSPDGQRMVTGGGDKCLHVWETTTGHKVLTLAGAYPGTTIYGLVDPASHGHSGCIVSVAFSHDGKLIASADEYGGNCLWDATGAVHDVESLFHSEQSED